MAPSNVVLPAPLGPMTVTMLPSLDLERNAVNGFDLAVGHAKIADVEERAHVRDVHTTPPR